jgi:hypothetical protein
MKIYKKYTKLGVFFFGSLLSFLSLYFVGENKNNSFHIDASTLVNIAYADSPGDPGGGGDSIPGDDGSCP